MPHLSPQSPGHRLRTSFLAELADSTQMARMFEHIPGVSFFAKNRSYQLMLGNSHFYKRFGFNDESDVVGRTDYELFPRPLADKFRADDEQVLSTGEPILHIVELFLNQQGIPDWFITQKLPLFGKSGHVVGLMGAIQRYEVLRSISAADAPIAKAANAFRRDPGQRWRMEEVARSVGLSQRQFDRKFHECYGVTPQHYLMKTRIQASCEMLRVTGTTIAEVAGNVGFYDQSAFTSQFRRQMGITPRRYQTQYRG